MTNKPTSIMWVDDRNNVMMTPVLRRLKQEIGSKCEISYYETVKEARDAIASDKYFDFAIVDLSMGDSEVVAERITKLDEGKLALEREGISDGEGVINDIRAKYPTMPILCMTGFSSYHAKNATQTVSNLLDSKRLEGVIRACIEIQKERSK